MLPSIHLPIPFPIYLSLHFYEHPSIPHSIHFFFLKVIILYHPLSHKPSSQFISPSIHPSSWHQDMSFIVYTFIYSLFYFTLYFLHEWSITCIPITVSFLLSWWRTVNLFYASYTGYCTHISPWRSMMSACLFIFEFCWKEELQKKMSHAWQKKHHTAANFHLQYPLL